MKDQDATPDELPKPVPLHIEWFREPATSSLRAFLVIIDVIADELTMYARARLNDESIPLHQALWEAVEGKIWDDYDGKYFQESLMLRRQIMSRGERGDSYENLDRRTLNLVNVLGKLYNTRKRYLR